MAKRGAYGETLKMQVLSAFLKLGKATTPDVYNYIVESDGYVAWNSVYQARNSLISDGFLSEVKSTSVAKKYSVNIALVPASILKEVFCEIS